MITFFTRMVKPICIGVAILGILLGIGVAILGILLGLYAAIKLHAIFFGILIALVIIVCAVIAWAGLKLMLALMMNRG